MRGVVLLTPWAGGVVDALAIGERELGDFALLAPVPVCAKMRAGGVRHPRTLGPSLICNSESFEHTLSNWAAVYLPETLDRSHLAI